MTNEEAPLPLPRSWEVAGTGGPQLLPDDSPLWDQFLLRPPGTPPPKFPLQPRHWDTEPEGVTHIAGVQMVMFGRYLRQRCEWCGIVLLEYDLERVAVPVGQEGPPAMWTPMALVRVDGHMSAEIDNPEQVDGGIQLPPDACAFNPLTQVGM